MPTVFLVAASVCAACALPASPDCVPIPPPPISEPPPGPPCATQEFVVLVRESVIAEGPLAELTQAVDLARPCNVLVATIVSPTREQGEAVRDAMAAQGFPLTLMQVEHPPTSEDIDQVHVTIAFR